MKTLVSAFSMYQEVYSLNRRSQTKKKTKSKSQRKYRKFTEKKSDSEEVNSSPNDSVMKRKKMTNHEKPKKVEKIINTRKNEIVKKTVKLKDKKSKCLNHMQASNSNLCSNHKNLNIDDMTDDPINNGFKLFEWMIAPNSPNMFFEKYWEIKPIHVARLNKKYFTHLLSSKNLDQIFRDHNLHYSRNVDVVCYENGEKLIMNPEGRAVACALWDYYNNGCSIRVLNPQTYSEKIHLLVTTLQEYFGSLVGVNAYLTPPNSQGFAPHYDDIEAFVIQLEGRKHWKLYKPKDHEELARYSSKNFNHEEIGDPFQQVTLESGSLLYFPRGVIHEGSTDPESHSLHLTISVYQNNAYIDLLEKIIPNALSKAAECDIDFRKGLPLHFIRNSNSKQVIEEKIVTLFEKLKGYLDVHVGINELGRKLVYDSMPPVLSAQEISCSSKQDGDLLDNGIVFNKVEFQLSTKVRLTRYHCIQLINDGAMNPKLYYSTENANFYHGEDEQWLELEWNMVDSVKALQNAYPNYINVDCLPIKDAELKVQFVYDLWEKGIIITKEPLTNSIF